MYQLLGGRRVPEEEYFAGAQMYQSRFDEVLEERESRNQACWSEVWFTTKSIMSFMLRDLISAIRLSTSARVP
jgi:hypothetical protein